MEGTFYPQQLPPSVGGLAGRVPPAPPGSVFVLAAAGGFAAPPKERFEVLFGRQEPDVHVCVGANDPRVSRLQGRLHRTGGEWWLRNDGKLPIRLPQSRFLLSATRSRSPRATARCSSGHPAAASTCWRCASSARAGRTR